jgi:hypothetical protein
VEELVPGAAVREGSSTRWSNAVRGIIPLSHGTSGVFSNRGNCIVIQLFQDIQQLPWMVKHLDIEY